MHECLGEDDILRLLARELVASGAKATAVSLACCCKLFEDPALDELWETQYQLFPLLKSLPVGIWEEKDGCFVSLLTASTFPALNHSIRKSFKKIPTKAEWTHFQKYTRRMRELKVDISGGAVASGVLQALQLRTANRPLLPGLKIFECLVPDEAFVPFIPLFLSPDTVEIKIEFVKLVDRPSTVMVASTISKLSTLCPKLESIVFDSLPRDSVITEAVSEMLLGCNRYTLQEFEVDSPLTEEARGVLYQLPELCVLRAIIQGPTSLPPVALPNLTSIDIEYDGHLDWLEGFREAALEKLDEVCFRSESEQIGDFFRAFEDVALTTFVQDTLSTLEFCTSRSWDPNYRSLLQFTQLTQLDIEFSCRNGCSSTVDDDVIISLVHAMPKLEILRLGRAPCRASTGVTIKGLIALSWGCLRLSKLRIHFKATSLVEAATGTGTPSSSGHWTAIRREDCGLTDLEVGNIPFPEGSAAKVAIILLQIFPHLLNVIYLGGKWHGVVETIELFKQIETLVQDTSKASPPPLPYIS
jgi:hypothetical protein